MRVFRLKSSAALTLEAGGGAQLRDAATGRVMVLSRTEGELLSSVGRSMSPEDILERVRTARTDLDQPAVLALFTRLAAAGFLDVEGSKTPLPSQAPVESDVSPCIRNDLEFFPGKKLGTVEVRDAQRQRSFTLYDFEVNIARMLDGRRTFNQVVETAERLGIQTSPDAIRSFVRQLKAFDFLTEKPVPIQPPRGRRPWQPEIREMFRHALRHSRLGELNQAAEYLETLLEVEPEVLEARELLEQVQHRLKGGSSPGLDFNTLHGGRNALEAHEAPESPAHPLGPQANPFDVFEPGAFRTSSSAPSSSTGNSPSPPPIAPTLAPRESAADSSLALAGPAQPLPPLWTLSAVVPALPEVSDSVLTFDPGSPQPVAGSPRPTWEGSGDDPTGHSSD